MTIPANRAIEIGLTAAIVTVRGLTPHILAVPGAKPFDLSLPSGPFSPREHRTLEMGLRAWVADQTALSIGYAEQLYTFGDRGRHAMPDDTGPHVVSIGYLALTRSPAIEPVDDPQMNARWRPWYDFFPWEDWRGGRPELLDAKILPKMRAWAREGQSGESPPRPLGRRERLQLAFGADDAPWDEERVLDRYEILYEAGLVAEARRDGRRSAARWDDFKGFGVPMHLDHRRILATAITRLRGKLKYRPVVFELMPETFTLTELQSTVEAISGRHLHKQNFRRLVENTALVEPTGGTSTKTGGRPAALFRFRREVMRERPTPGLRV